MRRGSLSTAEPASTDAVALARGGSVFARVLVGIDGSDVAFEAVRQGARLLAPGGRLLLVGASYLVGSSLGEWSAERIEAELEHDLGAAMRHAKELAGPRAEQRLVNGSPLDVLRQQIASDRSTLVVLGSHGDSRLSSTLIGGVCSALLHEAPCSVLVARAPWAAGFFPRSLAVGTDGSPEAALALATAEHLVERFGASSRVLAADTHPVSALVDASVGSDLLVVGHRGVHGVRSLWSVSERVAHRAPCSVLVVRAAR